MLMKRWMFVWIALVAMAVPLLAQEEGTGEAKGSAVNMTGKGYSAAIVIEPATKRVLFEENAHIALPTASMAKMMTLLLTMEEIRDGRLKWDDPVHVSARVARMGGSQVYLRDRSVWPVKNLVIATMIQSANDAAEALAEKIAGSAEGFADLMNQRAQQLGLKDSHFFDPHGLPNSENPKNVDTMSANDLAILGVELFKYPFMRQLAAIPEMPFQNGTLANIYNPNHLINPEKRDYYAAATGIKTGFSAPAGYCITAAAKRGNMELIAVVMGAQANSGPNSSFGIAARLFNEYFATWLSNTVVKGGANVGDVPVSDGQAKSVVAIAAGDVNALMKRGEEGSIKVSLVPTNLSAPVHKGQPIGTVVVTQNGKQINKVPALAANDVAKQPGWKKFWPF